MDILLIRHGQSVANLKGLLISGEQDDLTDVGRAQSVRLGESIASEGIAPEVIFSSPWRRALSTAKLVFPNRKNDFLLDSRLAETNPGKYGSWLESDFNDAFPAFYDDLSNKYEGGESHLDMAQRVCSWADDELLSVKPDVKTLAVMAHGGPISVILQYLLGIDIENGYPSFTVPNASASLLRWRSDLGRFVVIYIGHKV